MAFLASKKKQDVVQPVEIEEPINLPTPIRPQPPSGESYYNPANDVMLPMTTPNPTWILASNMDYGRYYRLSFPAGNPWDGWVYKKVSDNSAVAVENFDEAHYGCCI